MRSTSPSAPVAAFVQHDDPPAAPPAALTAFVEPVRADGALAGWRLTRDVVAFARPGILDDYLAWRRGWERCFVLDSAASIRRLAAVGSELLGAAPVAPLAALVAAEFEAVVEPARLAPLVVTLAAIGASVRDRGARGFGAVDATPGGNRVGLAGAWSPGPGPELLASDEWLAVELTADGLRATPTGGSTLDAIAEVAVLNDVVRVVHASGVAELAPERARPLAWLVPGATVWRVRAVPEPIVWARTLAGVEEAARVAGSLGLPVRFSSHM